jgi:hypothetical protein
VKAWTRRNYSWLLALARGAANSAAVLLGLRCVPLPWPTAIAEGLAAGLQSAALQSTPINERYCRFLRKAPSEPQRFLRWATVSAAYYLVVKVSGTWFGGERLQWRSLLATVALGTVQYPWVAAIAVTRARKAPGQSPDKRRFLADVRTMAVSMSCVCLSVLSSVGVRSTRLLLVAGGLAGAVWYCAQDRSPGPGDSGTYYQLSARG